MGAGGAGEEEEERRGRRLPSTHTHQMRPMKGYMMNMIGHQ